MPANGPTAVADLATPGDRLRFLRRSKDWTQDTLAKKVFTTQPTIARYERNEFVPHRATQLLLAEQLGVSRDFLFGEA